MHPYSINSEEHRRISLYISVLAILFAWGLSCFSTQVISIPWWIEAPSVMGFYGLLNKMFDLYIWKFAIWRKLKLIKTPIVDGIWEGTLTSSSSHATGPIKVNIKIQQTWTHIRIFLKTDSSESYSFEASMTVDHFDTTRIHYQYMNSPKDASPATMHIHCGAVTAKIIDSDTIEAEYFSGRDRNNNGAFTIQKL